MKFNPDAIWYDRCFGIIGENGVGKTTMLGGLIDCLINHKSEDMLTELPLFSSVMAISTTPLDCFADIRQNIEMASIIPYYYFCVKQDKNSMLEQVKKSVLEIRKRKYKNTELFDFYDKIIVAEIPDISLYKWYYNKENKEKSSSEFIINDVVLTSMLEDLSSGQLQLFLLITFIFRKINFDTLLIIDEPEVHLHPKAINVLFKLLTFLLNKFQSFCIVSTHSPLIVRELTGKNVYLMRRNNKNLVLGKLGIETLGEDVSILYDEIFGYEENTTSLARYIRQLKKKNKSYKEIVGIIKKNSTKISLNTRMLIKQITDYEES